MKNNPDIFILSDTAKYYNIAVIPYSAISLFCYLNMADSDKLSAWDSDHFQFAKGKSEKQCQVIQQLTHSGVQNLVESYQRKKNGINKA